MVVNENKEVYFDEYCTKCKYAEESDEHEVCRECLSEPVALYSHKPVKFEEK